MSTNRSSAQDTSWLGSGDEPSEDSWRQPSFYGERLERDFLQPLRHAAGATGQAPRSLQIAILDRLHWYFTVDGRPRAPTVVVDDRLAEDFHSRVGEVMNCIEADSLEEVSPLASVEVRHALLSYKKPTAHSSVYIDGYDHEQQLVRLKYWVHGEPPRERFLVDAREVRPAHAKYRACKYFRRILLRERIVWLPAGLASTSLEVRLGDNPVHIAVGPQPFGAPARIGRAAVGHPVGNRLLEDARRSFHRGKGRSGSSADQLHRLKARAFMAMAAFPAVAHEFRDAWVFMDRETDADDNAEHLYRWVRKAHPEVNAWFLLAPGTPDWTRLETEGFRLMPPGMRRRMLLLNSSHIISSHPDYCFGETFDRTLYGDAMQWRFTYLKHGVDKDDVSHWYNDRDFDCMISSSPPEYLAAVSDDTPYDYTKREVRLCNMPRHDRLLQLAAEVSREEADQVVVMPTWRGSLLEQGPAELTFAERLERVASSEYAESWRRVLNDAALCELLKEHGKRIVFLPHSNLVPYLDAFALPSHVEIAEPGKSSIQAHFAKCCAFLTDYTSAAFDVALLRRAVFYYQFDREKFYGGEHNWRPGYFDYDRDGFGPVARSHEALLGHLSDFFAGGGRVSAEYLSRMERATPDRSQDACRCVFEAISSLRRPYQQAHDPVSRSQRADQDLADA